LRKAAANRREKIFQARAGQLERTRVALASEGGGESEERRRLTMRPVNTEEFTYKEKKRLRRISERIGAGRFEE